MNERTGKLARVLLVCMLLAGVTLAVFWPVAHHPFINLDDPEYLTENPRVLDGLSWDNATWAFRTGHAANWHPLTWLSHMLDVQWFGLNAGPHHLTSLALHTAAVVMLFLALRKLTGAFWRSATVAALFAVHPLHVESVAWVAERKDVLSGLFFMLTLWAYAMALGKQRVVEHGAEAQAGIKAEGISGVRPCRLFYWLSLLVFALGLMSKPMLVTVPFVLLLLDFWPLHRFELKWDGNLKSCVVEKIPFFALALASSIVTFLAQEKGEAVGSMEHLALDSRIANALLSYFKYLSKTIWPSDLAVFYPHPFLEYGNTGALWAAPVLWSALVLGLVTIVVVLRRGREQWLFVGWFWFVGMLVPVIGLVQVGSQGMADRYTYLPLIGLFICLAWLVTAWFQGSRLGRFVVPAAGVAAVVACAGLARKQVLLWSGDIPLFEHTLAVTTRNATAHFNLSTALGKQGKFETAEAHLRSALVLIPTYPPAHYNLGMALMSQGKLNEAATAYTTALQFKPDYFEARLNLGTVLLAQGKAEAAIEQYSEAVRQQPESPPVRFAFGNACLAAGKFADACAQFTEAVRLKPDYVEAISALGRSLGAQGKWDEAQAQFQALLRLHPTNAAVQVSLGLTLAEAGRTNEAAPYFAEALRLDPALADNALKEGTALVEQGQVETALARYTVAMRLQPGNAAAHEGMGMCLAQFGRLEQAVGHFEQCLKLRPDAQSHYYLGLARVMQGKHAEAVAEYREAARLNPDWPAALNDLAWILATHPQGALRDGPEAVRLAERACELSGGKETRYWGTLDAAYARTGKFDQAIATAEKTRQLASAAGQSELARAAESRLELYRKNQPFTETR